MAYTWPIAGVKPGSNVTNPFGAKQARSAGFTGSLPSSNVGLDIGAAQGTPIVAPASGVVVSVGTGVNAGWGNSVLMRDDQGNQFRLSHMRDVPMVKAGQSINAGQQLGVVGMTGNATGPHLDFEYKPKDGGFANPMALSFDVSGPGAGVSTGLPGGPSAPTPPSPGAPPPGGPGDDKNKSAIEQMRQNVARLQQQITADEQASTDQSLDSYDRDQAKKRLVDLRQQLGTALNNLSTAEARTPPAAAQARVQLQGNRLVNLDTGETLSLPDTPLTATEGVSLATAQVNLQRALLSLQQEQDPLIREAKALQLKQAQLDYETAVRKSNQPTDVATPANQPNLVRRAPDGSLVIEPNPNYQAPAAAPIATGTEAPFIVSRDPITGEQTQVPNPNYRAPTPAPFQAGAGQYITQLQPDGTVTQVPNPNYVPPTLADPVANYQQVVSQVQADATRERDRLLELQKAGTLDPLQARQRFEAWWQQNVDTRLAGARAMAERTREGEQRKLEEQQRAEDVRVEDINRARETGAFQAGQSAVQQLLPILPQVRSQQYLSDVGANVGRIGRGEAPQYSAGAFDPANYRQYIPDFNRVAQEQAARFLANISPSAARMINQPLPQLPAQLDINSLLGELGAPNLG